MKNILPSKKYPHDPRLEMPDYETGYNRAISDCQAALEKALREGVIVEVKAKEASSDG